MTLRIVAAIFCTTAGGVPAGANAAIQPDTSKPLKPASAKVGTFGMLGARPSPATASTLILPLREWILAVPCVTKAASSTPPTMSVTVATRWLRCRG